MNQIEALEIDLQTTLGDSYYGLMSTEVYAALLHSIRVPLWYGIEVEVSGPLLGQLYGWL